MREIVDLEIVGSNPIVLALANLASTEKVWYCFFGLGLPIVKLSKASAQICPRGLVL